MSLLSPADQERLREELSAMTRPVRLLFFTQTLDCETCLQTREILDELPALSDQVSIEEVNFVLEPEKAAKFGIDRVPAIALVSLDDAGADRDSNMRFLGTPAGYEFISLIHAVRLAGGGPSHLSAESHSRVASVDRPMTVRVFTTPTCPHCPRAVNMAHEMAWANAHITAFAVEVTEYPDLARRYRVSGVPMTVVDETVEILGALPEDDFISQSLSAVTADGSSSAAQGHDNRSK
jgi:glutaredoxin-like protein